MIDSLRGRVLATRPDLLMAVGPLVLRLEVSERTRIVLAEREGETTVYTLMQLREERLELIGFASSEERSLYQLLTSVSGVGKRLALAILSELAVETLAKMIHQRDGEGLTKVPGVGKKTASRLLLELSSKLDEFLPIEPAPALQREDPRREEVLDALAALGMNRTAALKALEQVREQSDQQLGVEEMIRRALAASVRS